MSVVYREGGVSCTLTGDLIAWAEDAIRAATSGASDVIAAELTEVALDAEAQWYGAQGVHRETGLSGRMTVIKTLDVTRGVVRFSVGSTDVRPAGRAVVATFVHRPGRNNKRRPGDGKRLLVVFVNTPGKTAVLALTPQIAAAMASKIGATHAR